MNLQRNKKELLEAINTYIKNLTIYEQYVIREFFWNNKTIEQIAVEGNLTEQAVMKLLKTAKDQLRQDLETHLDFKFYKQSLFNDIGLFQEASGF